MGLFMCAEHPQRPQGGVGSLGARVTGPCEPLLQVVRKQPWSLHKQQVSGHHFSPYSDIFVHFVATWSTTDTMEKPGRKQTFISEELMDPYNLVLQFYPDLTLSVDFQKLSRSSLNLTVLLGDWGQGGVGWHTKSLAQ